MVLCECSQPIDLQRVPSEVLPAEGANPWALVVAGRAPLPPAVSETRDFAAKLAKRKTCRDVSKLCTVEESSLSSAEADIRSMGEVLEKVMKPPIDGSSYKRLRIFSGTLSTPAGEESLDHWMDQAQQMVRECDCSDREKRKRVGESVKGPALEVIQAVFDSNPEATPQDYLKSIEDSFGCSESGEDLYFRFRSTRQLPKERLSEFLIRIDRMLRKAIRKGGAEASCMDRMRMEQLIRVAPQSDLMLIHLHLRERKETLPSYLILLKEIRDEEELQEATKPCDVPVQALQITTAPSLNTTVVQSLQEQIQDLQQGMIYLCTHPNPLSEEIEPEKARIAPALVETRADDGEVRNQIWELQQAIAALTVAPVTDKVKVAHMPIKKAQTSNAPIAGVRHTSVESSLFFSYRCGEDGNCGRLASG
ncbi:PNMA1 protein, partial [Polyodon spathula]|nr:PNMA1 protein [Polyodon spathula]